MDGPTGRYTYESEPIQEIVDGWMDGWMAGWMMDGWMTKSTEALALGAFSTTNKGVLSGC